MNERSLFGPAGCAAAVRDQAFRIYGLRRLARRRTTLSDEATDTQADCGTQASAQRASLRTGDEVAEDPANDKASEHEGCALLKSTAQTKQDSPPALELAVARSC